MLAAMVSSVEGSTNRFDLIVVLGCPATADGSPSPTMKERVLEAVRLYRQGRAPGLMVCGAAVYNGHVEARVMAGLAQQLGVSPEHIFLEEQSRNTYQNIFNAVRLAEGLGCSSLLVVTSKAHARRVRTVLSWYPNPGCVVGAPYLSLATAMRDVGLFFWEACLLWLLARHPNPRHHRLSREQVELSGQHQRSGTPLKPS